MCIVQFPLCVLLAARTMMESRALNLTVVPALTSASVISEDDSTSSASVSTTQLRDTTPVDEPLLESLPMYRASVELKRVCLPFIIAAGTFGNVVVVLIQRRFPSNHRSCLSVYFTALAVSDTMALWTAWFWVLETFGVTLSVEYHLHRNYSDVVVDALCRVRVWAAYTFGQISAWILVSMTIHRALSIVLPHRTNKFLTQTSTWNVVVFIVLLCTLSNAHIFYGHSLRPANDGQTAVCFFSFVNGRYGDFFSRLWVWEDIVVAVFLPFTCLIVTNSVLVRKVGQSLREARENLADGRSDQFASREKKMSSMTLTLIAMSIAFLVLTSPVCVYMILERTLADDMVRDVRVRAASELGFSVGMVMWFTNVAINFYLYCLTGARYRAEFLRLVGCAGFAGRPLTHADTHRRHTASFSMDTKSSA